MAEQTTGMFLLVLISSVGVCLADDGAVQMLTVSDFRGLEFVDELQVIYFKKKTDDRRQDEMEEVVSSTVNLIYDDRSLPLFFKEYSKAAKILADFAIPTYMVDCEKAKELTYCKLEESHHNVYIFRKGTEVISLGLESMFDADAIVSNVLQILLLREVPILQSLEERTKYENVWIGRYNVIFSLQEAIGTRDHRVFMELAWKYYNKYKFALTTEKEAIAGLTGKLNKDESAVWLLQCEDHSKSSSKPCPVSRYYGKMTLNDLSIFLDDSTVNNIHELTPNNLGEEPFAGTMLHHVLVFTNDESADFVREHAQEVLDKFRGTIGMIFINVDHVKNPYEHLIHDQSIPSLGFKNIETGDVVFMIDDTDPEDFIELQVEKSKGKKRSKVSNAEKQAWDGVYTSERIDAKGSMADVERQDDEIATAVSQLRGKIIHDESLLSLTDKTFPIETTNRDLLIVIFYLPFDAMSAAVYHSFIAAANTLVSENKANPLSSVNCHDWTDVCGRENVTAWPQIRVYRKGRDFKIHKMIVSPENILHAVSLYQVPAPLEIQSLKEFGELLDGNVPHSDLVPDTVVIGLVKTEYDAEAKLIADVASELHGHMVVSMASGSLANKIAEMRHWSEPSLVVYKRNDPFQESVVHKVIGKTRDELVAWARQAAIPVLAELSPTNLPQIYARKQLIAIYFSEATNSPDPSANTLEAHQLLGKLAAEQEFPGFTFTWMDKSKDVTKEVMRSYMGYDNKEQLAVLNQTNGHVYVYGKKLDDVMALKAWLKSVSSGKREPNSKLPVGDWKPKVPPYDFIKLIEEDNSYHRDRDRIGHKLSDDEEIVLGTGMDGGFHTTKDGMMPDVKTDTISASDAAPTHTRHTEL